MAQNTDFNVSPYYDDYDESKNFHRILFRPSNAIQARELTQLQSILQNQVERFGNHIFDEGSLVMGGTVTVNTLYEAVKVNAANPNGSGTATAETYREASVGKYYQGKTSGVVAKVVNSAAATSGGDPLTLYVTYMKANADSSSTTYSKFLDNEEIEEVALSANGSYSNTDNSNNEFKTILPSEVAGHDSSTSTGSAATVRGGVFYTRGFFVRCDEQTILLDKYSNTPTYRIGLQITETAVSSTDDTSLLDNASGTTNENAPGANRLKIALTLVAKATSGTQDIDNFIELSRVDAGTITKQTAITAYNTLERTLARRTFDESGDYIVKPFQVELREHFNNRLNGGIYLSSNTVNPGDESKFVSVVSSGKAYVKGFEVDKASETFIEIDKARTKQDAGAQASPFEIGNYYTVTNAFGQPEFGTGDTGDIRPFGACLLRDTAKANPEGGDGAVIGRARVRFYDAVDVTVSSGIHTAASQYRLHLFDVRMYTKLTTANTAYALTAGQRVKGTVSGAKGTVAVSSASGATTVYLMDVEGSFSTQDTLRLEHATASGKAISAIREYSTDDVRQTYQASIDANAAVFAADTVLTDNQFVLSGTVFVDQSDDADKLLGTNTKFTQELKVGDKVVFQDQVSGIIDAVVSDTEASLSADLSADNSGKLIRQRAQIQEQEKTIAIAPTPKNFVSSITPNTLQIRKQKTVLLSSSTGSLTGVADETLFSDPTSETDNYIVTIHEAEGSETNPEDNSEGRTISTQEHDGVIEPSTSQGGAIAIASANSTPLGAADQLKVIYGATKDVANNNASKTLRRSRGVNVTSTATANAAGSASAEVYGTNINDELITLGVPDVYAVRAIYESNDTAVPLPPKLTVASGFANANPGDRITGSVSGATGKIIQVPNSTTIYFYYSGDVKFVVGDTITNETSTNTATNSRVCSAIDVTSKDITGNYLLDDGQRDGYYGLASIKRKPGAPTPANKLLVVFDYFTSGGGSFHTVNSYSDLEFENIPTYIPNIIDPTGAEPDGEIELSDAVDFRSYVHSLHDISAALDPTSATDVSSITSQPFDYDVEEFTSARAVTFDLPKSGQSLLASAMEHYLPRIDKISLSSDGDFIVSTGEPAEVPAAPTTPSNSILLHTMYLPAYTIDIGNVSVQSQDHKRFTMKDIGRIQGRVKNLERVSSLNALEQETNLTQIQDADGLDRFKSGFVTDNFRGHKTGDVDHPDYKIAVDRTTGTLRPMHNSKFVDLDLNTGASSGYTKTGDLITLPFTEEAYVNIDKASGTEFVNPYDVVLFNGTITLNPSRDLWFDTERLPAVRRTVEGDYDTVLAGVENSLGTIWNNWQSDWLGEPVTTVEEPTNRTVTSPTRTGNGAATGDRPLGSNTANVQNWMRWETR